MKVAIVGAGAVGGYYGAVLAKSGEEVAFIARGAHLEAMQQKGLQVDSVPGDFLLPAANFTATENPADVGPVDLVFFSVKTYGTEAAARSIPPLLGPETVILTVQNGVDNVDRILQALAPLNPPALAGAVYIEATLKAPGHIVQGGGPRRLVFGELDGRITQRGKTILESMERAEIPCEFVSDIEEALWTKFLYICPMSGLTAVTGRGIRAILDLPETRALFVEAMQEVDALARARGVTLPKDAGEKTLAFADGLPDMRSSLQKDLEAGRPLEIESLSGAVVRLGEEAGVQTPIHRVLYACLKAQDPGGQAQRSQRNP